MSSETQRSELNRRDVLSYAGVAAVAAPFALSPEIAAAQSAAPDEEMWTREYWAHQGDTELYLFRKRAGAPAAGEAPKPVLIFVHGSSMAGRSSFDVQVPDAGEYSIMNVFARLGYDTWTMDFEGYGRSTKTGSNSDVAIGVQNLAAASDVLARETGASKFHFMGQSSGALRAAAFAMHYPERVNRLVLGAFTYTGVGAHTLIERARNVEVYRANNVRPRDLALISGIFTRDMPGTGDPRVAEALMAMEIPHGDTVPSGTYLDMTANLPVVDPTRVMAPTLLIRGVYDGIATVEDLANFFAQLPNPDRQFIILPGLAHSLHLGYNRAGFYHAMQEFLTLPPMEVVV